MTLCPMMPSARVGSNAFWVPWMKWAFVLLMRTDVEAQVAGKDDEDFEEDAESRQRRFG